MDRASADAARSAGLRYVSDLSPGLRRKRRGAGFTYIDARGKAIRDAAVLERIRSLAIPPAYENVWISPSPIGHIQATARDARGRKQYRYHPHWREVRDGTKYERLLDFAKALPALRRRVDRDLRRDGMPREKILAAVVRLLETTSIRVGNDEYARTNGSFGLTTLQNRHAHIKGADVSFSFRGKSGVVRSVGLHDKRLAKIVRSCQDLPGQRLFEYLDEDGRTHDVDSNDVNDYIREVSGGDFTAKDFRTWVGTVACADILAASAAVDTIGERKTCVAAAMREVAARLGNTAAVCRKSYVHPDLVAAFIENGCLGSMNPGTALRGLPANERFVVTFLQRRAKVHRRAAPPRKRGTARA